MGRGFAVEEPRIESARWRKVLPPGDHSEMVWGGVARSRWVKPFLQLICRIAGPNRLASSSKRTTRPVDKNGMPSLTLPGLIARHLLVLWDRGKRDLQTPFSGANLSKLFVVSTPVS